MKIYKCDACGNVYEKIGGDSACTPTCCGKSSRELVAGEVDAAAEKHVPVVEKKGDFLVVNVGSVEHPMLPEHYITNVWAEFEDGSVVRIGLLPGNAPTAQISIQNKTGKVVVYEYCNLHGLWKTEIEL